MNTKTRMEVSFKPFSGVVTRAEVAALGLEYDGLAAADAGVPARTRWATLSDEVKACWLAASYAQVERFEVEERPGDGPFDGIPLRAAGLNGEVSL